MTPTAKTLCVDDPLPKLLMATTADIRAELLLSAASFQPSEHLHVEHTVGPVRAAFADAWEKRFGQPVPIVALRDALEPPVAIGTLLPFLALKHVHTAVEMYQGIAQLLDGLQRLAWSQHASVQLPLFDCEAKASTVDDGCAVGRGKVAALSELVAAGIKYPTVYADPPWQYTNRASRAAAENHYRTLSIEQICREPVRELATENAHLHLWTTNAFLQDAFTVIDAWGFTFKSCLVWVKDELGMGNYWRLSHEFLECGDTSRSVIGRCKAGCRHVGLCTVGNHRRFERWSRESAPARTWKCTAGKSCRARRGPSTATRSSRVCSDEGPLSMSPQLRVTAQSFRPTDCASSSSRMPVQLAWY